MLTEAELRALNISESARERMREIGREHVIRLKKIEHMLAIREEFAGDPEFVKRMNADERTVEEARAIRARELAEKESAVEQEAQRVKAERHKNKLYKMQRRSRGTFSSFH